MSEDTKKKLSQSKKGTIPWNKGKKCPPLSPSHKQAIADGLSNRPPRSPESIAQSVATRKARGWWAKTRNNQPMDLKQESR